MGIAFGNVRFKELAKKHGFELTDEENKILEDMRTDNANFNKGEDKCHVFDAPEGVACGTKAVFDKVYDILSKKKISGRFALYIVS